MKSLRILLQCAGSFCVNLLMPVASCPSTFNLRRARQVFRGTGEGLAFFCSNCLFAEEREESSNVDTNTPSRSLYKFGSRKHESRRVSNRRRLQEVGGGGGRGGLTPERSSFLRGGAISANKERSVTWLQTFHLNPWMTSGGPRNVNPEQVIDFFAIRIAQLPRIKCDPGAKRWVLFFYEY